MEATVWQNISLFDTLESLADPNYRCCCFSSSLRFFPRRHSHKIQKKKTTNPLVNPDLTCQFIPVASWQLYYSIAIHTNPNVTTPLVLAEPHSNLNFSFVTSICCALHLTQLPCLTLKE